MALRTFRFNPALGGFGGESSNDIGLLGQQSTQDDDDMKNRRRRNKPRNDAVANGQMRNNNGDDGKEYDGETTTTSNSHNNNHYHHADAFAQIIKELVDNSVDACAATAAAAISSDDSVAAAAKRCSSSSSSSKDTRTVTGQKTKTRVLSNVATTTNHRHSRHRRLRIRVTIEPWVDDDDGSNNNILKEDNDDVEGRRRNNGQEILRVTVLDNGVGMEDIETCVDPFRTTKAHNNNKSSDNNKQNKNKSKKHDSSNNNTTTTTAGQTAGRYGIGLTLCLLHAQRLVPNSRASIQSTTAHQSFWSVLNCVVDTNGDSVRCFPNVDYTMTPINSNGTEGGPPVVGRRPKSFATESGTAVSVLVPGGATAALAWPRLAEYFARFKLSRGLCCCVEVFAPTLSKIPLQVVPPLQLLQHQQKSRLCRSHGKQQQRGTTSDPQRNSSSQQSSPAAATRTTGNNMTIHTTTTSTPKEWSDFFDDQNFDQENSLDAENVDLSQASKQADKEKEDCPIPRDDDGRDGDDNDDDGVVGQVCRAAELYLGRPIPRSNVASSIVPIRQIPQRQQRQSSNGTQNRRAKKNGSQDSSPQLEVDVIVHGPMPMDDDRDEDEDEDALPWNRTDKAESSDAASMVLVRMVNRIPLLDSAEAIACGLVQGLASKKQMWNTFGLQVTHYVSNHGSLSRLPVYEVKDSAQVAPFFENHSRGGLLDDDGDSIASSDFEPDPEYDIPRGRKRKPKGSRRPQRQLHPAQIRLGNILVIVQIHADPSNLPLPTLSKGRLPFENSAIDTALEVALTDCLRQLQRSNPDLLLTAHELRKVERDVRYVPALSMAVASILAKSNTDEAAEYKDKILKWNTSTTTTTTYSSSQKQSQHDRHHHGDEDESSKEDSRKSSGTDNNVHVMCNLLEDRLRHVLTLHDAGNGKKTIKKKPAGVPQGAETESQEINPYEDKNGDDTMEYDDLLGSPDDYDNVERDDDLLDLCESSNSNNAYNVSESQASQASTALLSRRQHEEENDDEDEVNDYDEWL